MRPQMPDGPSVGEALQMLAAELATVADEVDVGVATAVRAVADRLRRGRFEVAVVGAFNRGKSTLCNALLGVDVLPSGVVPLTAVGTELRHGLGRPEVVAIDGRHRSLHEGETIADLVTERGNPGNAKAVARVVVPVVAGLLEGGLVLVDTPGTGSVHHHNDTEADRQLLQADGAIVVLSADSPLTDGERALLARLRERRARTFYVCNRADHLTEEELAEVRQFVTDQVAIALGRHEPVWCVSARAALQVTVAGGRPEDAGYDWAAFVQAFTAFAHNDLVGARHDSARLRLLGLCERIDDRLSLADAAARLDADTLRSAVHAFRAAAAAERQGWADDTVLLRRDVTGLVDQLSREPDHAPSVLRSSNERLQQAARNVGKAQMARALDDEVERIVREEFEGIRRRQAALVDEAWAELAERARSRAEARVNALRQLAADTFAADLGPVEVPTPADEPGSFSYHFVTVETPADQIVALARLLLPAGVLRRRLLTAARGRLRRELGKHAGRARVDMVGRVEDAGRRLERTLSDERDAVVAAVLDAADRAERLDRQQAGWRSATGRYRVEHRDRIQQIRASLQALNPIGGGTEPEGAVAGPLC
jgi:GTP-binding protein EngB required for normal cell division